MTTPPVPTTRRARVVAHYLPQFHPVPENDRFWGRGYTEWTAVATARPLFRGHVQPLLPSELGFYDLRLEETRIAQADLARRHGVEAFLYWHYWFGGRRVLERPFTEVVDSGVPDFPFCAAWANHSWTRVWAGQGHECLIEQTYPGDEDTRRHFAALEPAFHDRRYVRVDGKPLFFIFRPDEVPDLAHTVELWWRLAQDSGLGGLHIVGRVEGFWGRAAAERVARHLDAVTDYSLGYLTGTARSTSVARLIGRARARVRPPVRRVPYEDAVDAIPRLFAGAKASYPTAIPGWDSTPRHGRRGLVLTGRSPRGFEAMLTRAVDLVAERPLDHRLVFLKSWNEWGEGNFVEPDRQWGRQFLEACRRAVCPPDGAES